MIISLKNNLFDDSDVVLNINRVGQEHCNPRKKDEVYVLPCFSLHFVMFGMVTVIDESGKEYEVGKSEVFLLHKDQKYRYFPNRQNPWLYIWVNFTGENLDKLFAACGLTKDNIKMRVSRYDEFANIMRELYDAFDAGEMQQLNCVSYFLLMVGKLIAQSQSNQLLPKVARKKKSMREILIYINNNIASDYLSNETIARENGISVRGLTMLFDEMLGMSPVEYINRYRISTACERLQDRPSNITEAARCAGFDDDKYFARVFKKIMGMTPSDYVKSNISDDPFMWIRSKNMWYR